jgi:hypothetical protein
MQQVIEEPEVRADVIGAMRNLAKQGAGVRELAECVQFKVPLKQDALLPVLWYFMKAFYLPLGDVLPIREWLGTTDDATINALILPAIERTRRKWSA